MKSVQVLDGAYLEHGLRAARFIECFSRIVAGVAVALERIVAASPSIHPVERRSSDRRDRRKHSRSGRRAQDPHASWRRVYWLFGAYALFLSVRKLPATLRRLLRRDVVHQ